VFDSHRVRDTDRSRSRGLTRLPEPGQPKSGQIRSSRPAPRRPRRPRPSARG
jgi:hypothetical protein